MSACARYTISGWVTFFLVLGLAVVFWCIFMDPTEEERRRVLPPMTQTVDEDAQVLMRGVRMFASFEAARRKCCRPCCKLAQHRQQ